MRQIKPDKFTRLGIEIFIILLLIGVIIHSYVRNTIGNKTNQKELNKIIQQDLDNLSNFYKTGKWKAIYPSVTKCENISTQGKLDGSTKNLCNQDIFECALKSKIESIKFDIIPVPFENGRLTQIHIDQNKRYLYFKLKYLNSDEYHAYFENDCNMIALPERKYIHGTINYRPHPDQFNPKFWSWDSFGKNIKVMQSLVTNRDIKNWLQWSKLYSPKDLEITQDVEMLDRPVSQISAVQMKMYCTENGMKVLTSRILDAISSLPHDLKNPKATYVGRSILPWTHREKEHFSRKAIAEDDFRFITKANCEELYTKECLKYENEIRKMGKEGWLGHKYLLGGYMEYVENENHPFYNVHPSSFYLPQRSPWHQIGVRVHWDGEGFELKNFEFDNDLYRQFVNIDTIKVGFRCYID